MSSVSPFTCMRRLLLELLLGVAVVLTFGHSVANAAVSITSPDPTESTGVIGERVTRTALITPSGKDGQLESIAVLAIGLTGVTASPVPGLPYCTGRFPAPRQCGIAYTGTVLAGQARWSLDLTVTSSVQILGPTGSQTVYHSNRYGWEGSVAPPDHHLSRSFVDLGEIPIGASTNVTVDLFNDRTTPLDFASTDPLVTTAPLERRDGSLARLEAGASRAYSFGVRPTAPGNGSATATFNFADNVLPKRRMLTVQWTAVGPQIATDPATVDFGTPSLGSTATKTVTLKNTGNRELTIAGAAIDSAASVFALGEPVPASIAPGASVDVRVQCTPTLSNTFQGRLSMRTNDPVRPIFGVQLTCTGGTRPLSIAPLAFGNVPRTGTAALRLTNNTTEGIGINGWSAPDGTVTINGLDQSEPLNGTGSYTVQWTPTSVGATPPPITISTSVGDYVIRPTGQAIGARFTSVATIDGKETTDFGDVPYGQQRTASVIVTNTGNRPGTINDDTVTVPGFVSGPSFLGGTLLNPGASARFTVIARAPASRPTGTFEYTFVPTGYVDSPGASRLWPGNALSFRFRSVTAIVSASSESPDLGNVPLGQSADGRVIVRNTGTAPLTFTSTPTISGAGFSLVDPDTSPVPPGDSRAFTVRYAPTAPTPSTGVFTASTNAYGTSTVRETFTGSGVGPVATIEEAPLITDKIVFPETALGKSRSRTVTLRNTGNAPLEVLFLSIGPLSAAAFSVPDGVVDTPITLQPGESRAVTVRFAPTRTGVASGYLFLVSNAGTGQRTISLSGSGYVPGVAVADPDRLDFGAVDIDTSAALALTVRNTGPRAFTITGVTTPDGSQLSVDGLTTPVDINPSTGRGFTVRWSPTRDADLTGDLVVHTSEGELTVPVSGTVTTDRLFSKARPADTGGERPTQVALGDLNRDGRLDLVTAYAADGRVGVALGLGTGQFGATDFLAAATGSGALGLALADLDGDGALDITTGRSVYLGAGDGTFAAGVSTGISGEDVVVGDIDANGVPDLVVSSLPGGLVRLALGLGDGTFEAPTDIGTVAQPGSPVLADVNRDGRLDLIVGGRGSDQQVAVFINSGTGRLLEARYDTPSSTPYALAVGDLNNDQRPDISAAHSWLAGKADGTFAPAADGSVASDDLGIADFDGDGFDDQVVAGKDSPIIFVSRGLGDGTFTAPDEYDVGTTGGEELADLATGDLNGDGRVDIVAAKGGTRVDVLVNRQGIVEPGAGKALISELRFGSAGYVQVQNTSRTSPLRLDGWQLVFSSGERVTLYTGSALQPGGTLLVSQPTNDGWPFGDLARSVLALPGTALDGVRLVDALGEPVDAAGFDDAAAAYREGTAITSVSGSTGLTYLRRFSNGARVDTDDNAADFVAVDPEATEESGLLLGSPRPDGLAAPTNRNDILSTSLVDPLVAQSASPNRVIGGGKLTINRTITNCIGQPKAGVCANADTSAPGDTVTKLRLRITELSTIGNSQVGGAILKVVGSEDATYGDLKVNGLKLDAPTPASGGGINATLTATLPGSGLGPGESINVAITFLAVRAGAYRIGYDAEDDLIAKPKPGASAPSEAPTPSAVIDPAPAPAAPAIDAAATGSVTQAALRAPAPTAAVKPAVKRPVAKRCVSRAKYRGLTKAQRRTARICGPAKRGPATATKTPKPKATR